MAKHSREQFERGAYDALENQPTYYGCHFGMRNTLEDDKASYMDGHAFGKDWIEGKGEFANMNFDDAMLKASAIRFAKVTP